MLGADNVSILNFVPQGRGYVYRNQLMLSDLELEDFRQIFLSTRDQFRVGTRIGIPLLGADFHKCTAGLGKLVIKYDGTVLPCPAFKEYDINKLKELGIPIGNIYTDLEQIKIYNGTRNKPLCKKLYGIDRRII